MELFTKVIKITGGRNQWIRLVPLGDIHLGNRGCDITKLRRQVEYIKNRKQCYWIGMGDYLDCINYSDKRFDPTTIAPKYLKNLDKVIQEQVKDIITILKPIAHKCIGLLRGNHEESIRLKYHHDVMEYLYEAFNHKVPLLKDSALVRLRFVRPSESSGAYVFDIFCTHGSSGGRKGGGILNRLEDMIGYVDADIYLIGHTHKKLTASRSVLYGDINMNLRHKKRVMAVTGCFLNGYVENATSYLEKWGFPPTSTGCVKLMINPRRHDVHISE